MQSFNQPRYEQFWGITHVFIRLCNRICSSRPPGNITLRSIYRYLRCKRCDDQFYTHLFSQFCLIIWSWYFDHTSSRYARTAFCLILTLAVTITLVHGVSDISYICWNTTLSYSQHEFTNHVSSFSGAITWSTWSPSSHFLVDEILAGLLDSLWSTVRSPGTILVKLYVFDTLV